MDDPICTSCGRGLSLEEIERGRFKHLGGRVYCAECVAKMRRVGPTVCPQCDAHDTPLYNGTAYVCRQCGAELSRKTTPTRASGTAARARRPVKTCPYCAAVIPAESLKCRYCGSLLIREARDLEVASRQNLRMRFWLGSLLTASLFLSVLLVYTLIQRPGPAARPEAAAPAPAKPKTAHGADPLAKELVALRHEIDGLRAQQARARRPMLPARAPTRSRPAATRPAPEKRTAPTRRPAAKPKPKVVTPKPTPPKPAGPKAPTEAELAAAAYPAFAARLGKLKADYSYAEATAACRQFLAVHLDTPSGARVLADQTAIRAAIEQVRSTHVRRFQDALKRGDLKAARAVAAELGRYKAPEIRDDRARMAAEIKAASHKPAHGQARYLAQWKVPPDVKRLLAELTRRDDANARSRAAKQLGRLGHSAALMGLMQAVDDPDWYVAMSVIDALAAIGDPVALPVVARRTKASFPGTYHRAAVACRTLAQADRKKYADAWKLVDPKAVAREIVEGLTLISKEESNVTSRFRIALIDTLALLDAKDAVPAMRAVLKTKDEAVRAAVNAAIQKLTGAAPPAKPAAAPTPASPPKAAATPKPVPPKVTQPAKPPKPPAKAPAPAKVRVPAPGPASPTASLSGKIEPATGGKSLIISLPSKHGLSKGDRIELARNGKPLCIVQIVQADATRVVGNVVKQLDKAPPAAGAGITITLAK